MTDENAVSRVAKLLSGLHLKGCYKSAEVTGECSRKRHEILDIVRDQDKQIEALKKLIRDNTWNAEEREEARAKKNE